MLSNQVHCKEDVPICGRLESNFPSFKGDGGGRGGERERIQDVTVTSEEYGVRVISFIAS